MDKDIERLGKERLGRQKKHKKWILLTIMLSVIALSASVYNLIQPAHAITVTVDGNEAADLSVYIQDGSVKSTSYDANSGTVTANLEASFHIPKDAMNADNLFYYYTFPEGTIISDDQLGQSWQEGKDESNSTVVAFTYKYEKVLNDQGEETGTYRIVIKIDPTYYAGATEYIKGKFWFNLSFGKDDLNSEGQEQVQLGTSLGTTVTIPYENKNLYDTDDNILRDIMTSKSCAGLVYKDDGGIYLEYTVILSSVKGTAGAITYTDTLDFSGFSLSDFTISEIKKMKGDVELGNVTDKYSANVNNDDDGTYAWNLTLDELGAGENYTITYSYKVSIESPITDATFANNKAQASVGTDGNWDYIVSDGTVSMDKTKFETNWVEKSGSFNQNDNTITWTITVNASKADVAGKTLTDEMFSSLTSEQLIITPAVGTEIITEDDKVKEIKFTALDDSSMNTNSYTITYIENLKNETVYDGQTIDNTATLSNGSSATNGVRVDSGSVTKVATGGNANKTDQTVEITWQTTYTTPLSGIQKDTVYSDELTTVWGKKYQWFTYAQITDINDALKKAFGTGNYTLSVYELNEDYQKSSTAVSYAAADPAKLYCKFEVTLLNDKILTKDAESGTSSFTLTYRSMASLEGDDYVYDGVRNYYNTATVGKHSANATYRYADYVIKTDGNGGSATTSEHALTQNGQVSWVIKIAVTDALLAGADSLTLNDTINSKLTLEKIEFGTASYANAPYNYTTVYGGTTTETVDNVTADCASCNGNSVAISFSTTDSWKTVKATEKGVLYVRVTCKLNDDFFNETEEVTIPNTATVTYGTEKTYESNTQTQTITKQTETTNNGSDNGNQKNKVLEKTRVIKSTENGAGRMHYVIEINPKAEALNDGASLDLTDVLNYWNHFQGAYYDNHSYSMSLVAGSVKLYESDEKGKAELTDYGVTENVSPVSNDLWSYTSYESEDVYYPNDRKYITITAKIPDEKHLYLIYAYDMDTDLLNTDVTIQASDFKNTVSITGNHSVEKSEAVSWKISDSGASGSRGTAHTFRKVETGKSNKTLEGAVFRLYQFEDGKWEKTNITYTSSNVEKTYGIFTVQQTGGTGISDSKFQYAYNTAYYLVEEKAPDGYQTPEDPPKYYFYFGNDSTDTSSMPENFKDNAMNFTTDNGTTDIENKPLLTIQKIWENSDGSEITTPDSSLVVNVNIFKIHGESKELVDVITLDSSNQWTAVLSGLDTYDAANNLCTYTVEEFSVTSNGVDVSDQYMDAVYSDKGKGVVPGNTITITNRVAAQYTLPETGGTGRNLLYMFGGMLALGAGFLLIYKKHKII
jgi:LPXTG-motif cell wall-anchored protein